MRHIEYTYKNTLEFLLRLLIVKKEAKIENEKTKRIMLTVVNTLNNVI